MSNEDLYSVFTPAVEPEQVVDVEPVPDPAMVAKFFPPVEEPVVKSKKKTTSSSTLEGVVHLSILKTHRFQHNSSSSALIQERLIELGFTDAGLDNRGHMSNNTVKALAKFDGSDLNNYLLSESTIKNLFEDTAVEVVA
jgi:hypothetical protein